jgi:hypothetical protein
MFNDDIFVFPPSRIFPFFDETHLEDFPLPVDFLAAALLTLQLGVHGLPLAVTFLNNDHTAEQIHFYPFDEDYLQDRD